MNYEKIIETIIVTTILILLIIGFTFAI